MIALDCNNLLFFVVVFGMEMICEVEYPSVLSCEEGGTEVINYFI